MKSLIILALAALLSACAHETTTMDRELALKLVDRSPTTVVQSAPPVINVYAGGQSPAPQGLTLPDGSPDDRKNCINDPVYTIQGKLSHYVKSCFGSN